MGLDQQRWANRNPHHATRYAIQAPDLGEHLLRVFVQSQLGMPQHGAWWHW
jgi:hypothetical protein